MTHSKTNKIWIFILIWLVHIIVYYFIFGNIDNLINNYYSDWDFFFEESISRSLSSPITGLFGWYDGLPFFVMIPIGVMLILVLTMMRKNWFIAYTISCVSCYLGMYLYTILIDKSTNLYQSGINGLEDLTLQHIFLIIPSLIISILINKLIFKNKYRIIKSE